MRVWLEGSASDGVFWMHLHFCQTEAKVVPKAGQMGNANKK